MNKLPNYISGSDEVLAILRKIGGFSSGIILKDLSKSFSEVYINRLTYRILGKISNATCQLITAILELKLLKMYHTFLHAAAIDVDDKAVLIIAPPSTGKTFTALSPYKFYNVRFLGDDMIIVNSDANCLAFPSNITLHSSSIALLNITLPANIRASMYVRHFLAEIPFVARIINKIRIPIDLLVNNKDNLGSSKIDRIYFLDYGEDKCIEINKEIAFRKVYAAGRMHRGVSENQILLEYAYKYPDIELDNMIRRQIEIYSRLIDHAECYLLLSKKFYHYPKLLARHL